MIISFIRWLFRKKQAERYTEQEDAARNETEIFFDFDYYPVVSIERLEHDTKDEHTLVMSRKRRGGTQEWFFYCSRAQHQNLIQRHNEWRERTKKPSKQFAKCPECESRLRKEAQDAFGNFIKPSIVKGLLKK